jgi:bifunctional NMN adenylyltransferase/nudix hydrolase
MSNEINKFSDCGVIIGRFQVHKLTEAHFKLIQMVLERHKKVIIFLGVSGISPVPSTKRNPLDFELRKQMLEKSFSGNSLIISHLRDMKSDSEWSIQLDEKIKDLTSPNQTVMLYGGRDSFIKFYSGKFNTEKLEPEMYLKISGTELRNELKVKTESSDMFRAGVIWANENQYKHAIAVVDIAVFNDDYSKILLCRKSHETQYRFFGGFVDITDESYEQAAKREVSEETGGAETGDFKYVCSAQIHDWRYKNESDKVFTTLYSAKYIFGTISPNDDIVECVWKNIDDFNSGEFSNTYLVPEHQILMTILLKKYNI